MKLSLDWLSDFVTFSEKNPHRIAEALTLSVAEVERVEIRGDITFHINNHSIPHRADLFSHIGFARECVALGLGKWRKKAAYASPKFSKEPLPFTLRMDAKKLVPRYCACLLHIDGFGETPDWMRRRLEATGWRSVNLPTDITNYVLIETGAPLHSFDADDFRGDIHVRVSRAGERVVTLDGVERELPGGALVISDDMGVFDLLGIMGGLRSSTKEGTRNIYLQCASLDPVSIRRAIIATGHRTEGATVYEKGVPPVVIEPGFRRALRLFLELVPGARIASRLESHGGDGRAPTIALSLERVSKLLGREISVAQARKALTGLDFNMSGKRALGTHPRRGALWNCTKNTFTSAPLRGCVPGCALMVRPPLHRLGDIHDEADIAEEIARVSGFSTFEEEMPEAPIAPPKRDHRLHQIRRFLKEAGFTEVVRFAFLGGGLLRKSAVDKAPPEEIENPLGEDLRYLRSSLRPRLLEAAGENMRFTEGTLRAFEIGRVFKSVGERLHLSLLVASRCDADLRGEPFLIAKAAASGLLAETGFSPVWRDGGGEHTSAPLSAGTSAPLSAGTSAPLSAGTSAPLSAGTSAPLSAGSPYVHPARHLELLVGNERAGAVYEVHPAVCRNFDLPGRAAIATVDLTAVLALPSAEKVCEEIPEFPSITYDVTVAMKSGTEAGSLLARARGSHEWLRGIEPVDLFQKGEERRLTFRCTYNAGDRTLTEEEVRPVHAKVEGTLRNF